MAQTGVKQSSQNNKAGKSSGNMKDLEKNFESLYSYTQEKPNIVISNNASNNTSQVGVKLYNDVNDNPIDPNQQVMDVNQHKPTQSSSTSKCQWLSQRQSSVSSLDYLSDYSDVENDDSPDNNCTELDHLKVCFICIQNQV